MEKINGWAKKNSKNKSGKVFDCTATGNMINCIVSGTSSKRYSEKMGEKYE